MQEQLTNVRHIQATNDAFVAINNDDTVVAWGNAVSGGDNSRIVEQLSRVQDIPQSWLGAMHNMADIAAKCKSS